MSTLIRARSIALVALSVAMVVYPCAAQRIEARRILGPPPRLDGRLTEDLWETAPRLTGLLQRDPV